MIGTGQKEKCTNSWEPKKDFVPKRSDPKRNKADSSILRGKCEVIGTSAEEQKKLRCQEKG